MKYSGIWVVIPNQAWKTYGEIKPKQEWNESDNEKSEANPKAFYYILNGVSFDKFCRIITCKITRGLGPFSSNKWRHFHCEFVKITNFGCLIQKYKIRYEETFFEFYIGLTDFVLSCVNLEERIPESKVV